MALLYHALSIELFLLLSTSALAPSSHLNRCGSVVGGVWEAVLITETRLPTQDCCVSALCGLLLLYSILPQYVSHSSHDIPFKFSTGLREIDTAQLIHCNL